MPREHLHVLHIVMPGETTAGNITLDGKELHDVTRVDMTLAPNAVVSVRLTLLAHVTVEGELRESEIIHVERSRHCPHYWGDHSKRCLLDEGHVVDHVFPLTEKDIRDANGE